MTHDELNLTRQVANMIRTAKGKETDQASDIIALVRAAEQQQILAAAGITVAGQEGGVRK